MLKNDNEGNFKIKFYAKNRKEWKFLHKKKFWLGHSSSFLQFFQSLF
jgi:hypothetical protein